MQTVFFNSLTCLAEGPSHNDWESRCFLAGAPRGMRLALGRPPAQLGGPTVRRSLVYPLAAGLAWALAIAPAARAASDLERLEALEQELALLTRASTSSSAPTRSWTHAGSRVPTRAATTPSCSGVCT